MGNIKTLAEEIKESNEAFAKMTKAQKRVAIAKDCIERIKLNQLQPTCGRVVAFKSGSDSASYDGSGASVEAIINDDSIDFNCQVCAKGGLFMSYVGRVNDFTFDEIDDDTDHDSDEMMKLREIFGNMQLVKIETAFEGYLVLDYHTIKRKTMKKLIKFHEQYQKDDDRLIAICENIIKNDGKFKI